MGVSDALLSFHSLVNQKRLDSLLGCFVGNGHDAGRPPFRADATIHAALVRYAFGWSAQEQA